jgi:PAS domain-containing protein
MLDWTDGTDYTGICAALDRVERRIKMLDRMLAAINRPELIAAPENLQPRRIMVRYLPDPPRWTNTWVNAAYCRIFRCGFDQAVGRSTLWTTHDSIRGAAHRKLMRVLRLKVPLVGMEKSVRADGTVVHLRWMDLPIVSADGQVVAMLAMADLPPNN